MDRPHRTPEPSAGSTSSTKKITTTKTPRVRNWRRRYAAAPSWTASAISCILAVPCPAARTCLTSQPAIASASTAITATIATQVTLEPVTVAAPSARAEPSLVIHPPKQGNTRQTGQSARGSTSTGRVRHANTPQCHQVAHGATSARFTTWTRVPGVYASRDPRGASGPDVTTLRPVRDQTVTDESLAYSCLPRASRPQRQAGEPAASEPDSGQLILTLVPPSVSLIWTSSASPAITASEKPGGMRLPSAGLGTDPRPAAGPEGPRPAADPARDRPARPR